MQTSDEGSYHLRVRAVSWSGNGQDANGECCDSSFFGVCLDDCEYYFIFCKRPHGYDTSSEECPGGRYQTGDLGGNSVIFESPIDSGVPNPLAFTGMTRWPVSDHAYLYLAVVSHLIDHMHTQCLCTHSYYHIHRVHFSSM